jgi:hypothetical protein
MTTSKRKQTTTKTKAPSVKSLQEQIANLQDELFLQTHRLAEAEIDQAAYASLANDLISAHAVQVELAEEVAALFEQLTFVAVSLEATTAYRGDDIAVVHKFIEAIDDAIGKQVFEGIETGAYKVDTILEDILLFAERNDVFDLDPSGLSLDELIAADSNAFTADGDGVDELLQIAEELGIGEEIPLPD